MATPASLAHTELEPPTRILVTGPMADYGVTSLPDELILGKVHYLRGQKVMLDRDLAELYGVPVKRLKEQVRRNMERFPEAFMFELTLDGAEASRSHNATLKRGDNIKYLPFAFTERGILMLAKVLKSQQAIAVSIRIIDLFVRMRQALSAHKDILFQLQQLEKKVEGHDADIRTILHHLRSQTGSQAIARSPSDPRERIGYKADKA
ncbi:MAG: ORF6N domain-containing protein [Flavobacteriales bacterium]|nr:ORF6N domain-containing protein [Flavobacteriales bacterium]